MIILIFLKILRELFEVFFEIHSRYDKTTINQKVNNQIKVTFYFLSNKQGFDNKSSEGKKSGIVSEKMSPCKFAIEIVISRDINSKFEYFQLKIL